MKDRNSEFDPNVDCFKNALGHVIGRLGKDHKINPRIISKTTNKGRHAYVIDDGKVLNTGVTVQREYYPDVTQTELEDSGVDVTQDMLGCVIGECEDRQGYRRYVERRFGLRGVALARNLFHRIFTKISS